jgi:hypothetical protein
MQVNISNFKDLLKKCTLNYMIQSVQLNFENNKVKSKMVDPSQNAVLIINRDNDIIPELNDVIFNFIEPRLNVTSYLELFDNEQVEIGINDNKLSLIQGKQNADIYFCSDNFVSTFGGNDTIDIDYFYTMEIDPVMVNMLNKIKKIGGKFGKVYFSVDKNKFYMEAVDKSNRFSNGMKFELDKVEISDLECFYDFKFFNAILTVINEDIEDFKINFAYIPDREAGMILFEKNDKSEKYYLMSRIEG